MTMLCQCFVTATLLFAFVSPKYHLFCYIIDPQVVDDRERDIKCLQEQLRDAQQAVEASQTTQANQNQSSQSAKTGDASQAQEELAKLRQEVLSNPAFNETFVFVKR